MLFRMTELKYDAHPVLERAMEVLFILHADHEQNCSTSVMRAIGSSHADPYSAIAGAAAALYGPLHGGANEAVLRMLHEIGSIENVPAFIKRVKAGEGRLMGFGHRVYKSYDPRAKIIKRMADLVFDVTGKNPLLEMALELERIALEDDYFVSRKLYPNVDFYSGLIYQAMGFPVDMFPVLFAIPRTAGWIAQWEEMLTDPDQKIARPRQIYVGPTQRSVRVGRRSADEPPARGSSGACRIRCVRDRRRADGVPAAQRARPPRADLRRRPRLRRPPADGRVWSAARRLAGARADARLHQEAARGRRTEDGGAALRRADAARPHSHDQPARDASGRRRRTADGS